MEKRVKVILIVIMCIVSLVLLDTIQAKLFNSTPIFKVTVNYNGGTLYQKHKGILVDRYVYTNGNKQTVFKWEK